ncbi:MAG: hypothetical protein EOP84_32995 [Verrucomicrobiaceae bacterium]|nr:MAG: hypothetical protein EOP84_32995 [Verrucomicrobiaceae bacterium]
MFAKGVEKITWESLQPMSSLGRAYKLLEDLSFPQDKESRSFVGGYPMLPDDIHWPVCRLCGALQSFFLQIAFPDAHSWNGSSIAIFACTSCSNPDYLIPHLPDGNLPAINLRLSFFSKTEINYSFLVFPTSLGNIRVDYKVNTMNFLLATLSTYSAQ